MAPSAQHSPFAAKSPKTFALALCAALALSACGGGNEAEKAAAKAAAPLPRAFEALGLRKLSWAKVNLDGTVVVLRDAHAEMDGVGPVSIAEVTVRGFQETDGAWQADIVQADGVDGGAKARQVTVRSPRARRDGGTWSVRDEGRFLESYQGPLAGVPATLRSAGVGPAPRLPGRPDGTQMAASGLRFAGGSTGVPAALSNLDWDVSVRYDSSRPGAVSLDVQRAEAEGWSVKGRIDLVGGPGLAAALAGLKPAALLDAGQWPADASLREADLDMTVARPGGLFGTTAKDPVAGSLAARVAAGGPVSWHVRMQPGQPVPVRDLPAVMSGTGADARLGLSAQVRDVVMPGRAAAGR